MCRLAVISIEVMIRALGVDEVPLGENTKQRDVISDDTGESKKSL